MRLQSVIPTLALAATIVTSCGNPPKYGDPTIEGLRSPSPTPLTQTTPLGPALPPQKPNEVSPNTTACYSLEAFNKVKQNILEIDAYGLADPLTLKYYIELVKKSLELYRDELPAHLGAAIIYYDYIYLMRIKSGEMLLFDLKGTTVVQNQEAKKISELESREGFLFILTYASMSQSNQDSYNELMAGLGINPKDLESLKSAYDEYREMMDDPSSIVVNKFPSSLREISNLKVRLETTTSKDSIIDLKVIIDNILNEPEFAVRVRALKSDCLNINAIVSEEFSNGVGVMRNSLGLNGLLISEILINPDPLLATDKSLLEASVRLVLSKELASLEMYLKNLNEIQKGTSMRRYEPISRYEERKYLPHGEYGQNKRSTYNLGRY